MLQNVPCPPAVTSVELEPEEVEGNEKVLKDTKSKGAGAKAASKKKAAPTVQAREKENLPYAAGDFRSKCNAFLKKQKEAGVDRTAAMKAWVASDERAELLAGMSTPEKKRRRFV